MKKIKRINPKEYGLGWTSIHFGPSQFGLTGLNGPANEALRVSWLLMPKKNAFDFCKSDIW